MVNQSIKRNQPVLIFGVILAVVVTITAVGSMNFVNRVQAMRTQMSTLTSDIQSLNNRVTVLRAIQDAGITAQTQSALLALPDDNPSAQTVAQIRSLALTRGLIVDRLSLDVPQKLETDISPYSTVHVTFNVEGPESEIIGFVTDITKAKPLMNMSRVKIAASTLGTTGEIKSADIELTSFWAPLPSELPQVNAPITGLTESEKAILSEVVGYVDPPIQKIEATATTSGTPRENPYGLSGL